jgi:uncharacterized protein
MIPVLGAAFVLGLSASGHCVLMCGPLVAAVQPREWSRAVLMHVTRITVYAGIGAVTGAAGALVTGLGASRWLAWIVAATLIAQAVVSWRGVTGRGPIGRVAGHAVSALGRRLRTSSYWAPVVWGLINGLLPCGMVYSAATLGVGLASPTAGAAAMAAFGLGTIPVLLLVARPASQVLRAMATRRPWLAPAMLVILAVLIGLRGLPRAGTTADATASHHHGYESSIQR